MEEQAGCKLRGGGEEVASVQPWAPRLQILVSGYMEGKTIAIGFQYFMTKSKAKKSLKAKA